MAQNRDSISDYMQSLGEEPQETRFLKSIPWVIDAGQQVPSWLLKGLKLEAARLAELPRQMHFSLLTPMWNTPPRLLEELILSVRCQSWVRWELLLVDDGSRKRDHLEVARKWADRDGRIKLYELEENQGISGARNHAIEHSCGDFLAVLDHDDLLHPAALGVFARHLNLRPETNLIFSNEVKIDEASGRVSRYTTKPPFDLFTLLRVNYVCHFTAVGRELLLSAARDGRVFRSEYDGVEDHDLFLRLALTDRLRPVHVPLFLYYWRMTPQSTSQSQAAKPEIPERRMLLLEEMLPEIYPNARWNAQPAHPGTSHVFTSIKIRALTDRPRPTLLVLIPFKDNLAETLGCLESLERQQHQLDVLVALIDNGSVGLGTRPALEDWTGRPRRLRYEVIEHPGAFNFARLNNLASDRFGENRDLLLFLNNDVELKSADSLQTMAMQALADRTCGFVGIKLLYPDGQEVQHGGVRIAEGTYGAGYYVVDHPRGPEDFVDDEHVSFGVTFACAMVRRALYEELGGLDEVMFPNGFGDVDLCARALEQGYRNYYLGTLTGIHHESKSRGRVTEEVEFSALHERHGQTFAYWRLRNLTITEQYAWPRPNLNALPLPLPSPPPSPLPPPMRIEAAPEGVDRALEPPAASPIELPLRYRVADRLNRMLKGLPGPVHWLAKRVLLTAWSVVRLVRRRRPTPPADPRPHRRRLLRNRKSHPA
ncbi:hypothetical protein BH23PLA1_BH23PLA1_02350 [soil metagenome]